MTTQPTEPLAIVEAYLKAIEDHAPERMRRLLADEGFHYHSPIVSFDDPDAFLSYTAFSSGIVQRINIRKVFVDGPEVCHFLDFRVQLSDKMSVDLVQWATVIDGRIQRLELLFDAHPYRIMFGKNPTD